jgi:SAM-dependent methyltransferase
MSQVDIEREPLPFPSGEFETVLFTEILEHLRINPLHALREVARVLTPGGRLLLSTPHITPLDRVRFLWGRSYQGNPVREFRKLEWLGHMGHIRLYSLDEINEFLQEVGLRMQSHIFGGSYDAGSGVKGKLITLMLDLYPKRDAFRRITYVRAEKT